MDMHVGMYSRNRIQRLPEEAAKTELKRFLPLQSSKQCCVLLLSSLSFLPPQEMFTLEIILRITHNTCILFLLLLCYYAFSPLLTHVPLGSLTELFV